MIFFVYKNILVCSKKKLKLKNSEGNFFQNAILKYHRLQLFDHSNFLRNNKPPKTLHCFRILSSQTCTHRHQSERKFFFPLTMNLRLHGKAFSQLLLFPIFSNLLHSLHESRSEYKGLELRNGISHVVDTIQCSARQQNDSPTPSN